MHHWDNIFFHGCTSGGGMVTPSGTRFTELFSTSILLCLRLQHMAAYAVRGTAKDISQIIVPLLGHKSNTHGEIHNVPNAHKREMRTDRDRVGCDFNHHFAACVRAVIRVRPAPNSTCNVCNISTCLNIEI